MTELHKAAFQQSPVTPLVTDPSMLLCTGCKLWVCHAPELQILWEEVAGSQQLPGEMKKKSQRYLLFYSLKKKKKKSINKTTLTQLCPGSSCTAQQHSPLNCRLSGQIRLRATICRRSPARARSTRQCQSYRCPALINRALQLLAWATGDTFLCSTAHCITLLLVPKSWEVLKVQQSFASCLLHSVSPVPDLDKGFNSYIYHLIKWFLQTSQLVNTSTI